MELTTATSRSGRNVCVVATGAVTPVGVDASMTAASVRAGIMRHEALPFVDRAGEPMRMALAPVEAPFGKARRMQALAVQAAREALAALDVSALRRPVALCLGLPAPQAALDPVDPDAFVAAFEEALDVSVDATHRYGYALGHAAGGVAVEQAVRLLVTQPDRAVLVGGVDSYADALTLETLDAAGRLHSDANADGFVPGEGAAFCVLTTVDAARRYGWTPRALVRAVASGEEPAPLTSDAVCIGAGLTQVLHAVLGTLRDGETADWTLCDLNGESFGATEWTYAYLRTGARHGEPLEVWHPADGYGDVGAASGVMGVALAVEAWTRRYARGPRCLVWASSDDAPRAAILLQQAD